MSNRNLDLTFFRIKEYKPTADQESVLRGMGRGCGSWHNSVLCLEKGCIFLMETDLVVAELKL